MVYPNEESCDGIHPSPANKKDFYPEIYLQISAPLNLHALYPYYRIAKQLSICINGYLL
jgi:hypothetical protein